MKTGVMVCGHGSRNEGAVREFAQVAEGLRTRLPQFDVDYGYLEFATPIIKDGLDRLREKGCERILAVPGMLFAAGHAKNDIPSVLNTYGAQHNIEMHYGRELGVDNKMIRAAGERVREAMQRANAEQGEVPAHETLLVVVGRGASDPDANGNVTKITRMLWEGLGFGWAETAYSGVTFPLVMPALEKCAMLGFKRIVVFPYFLFTGVLVNRIYDQTDEVAANFPGLQFIKAGYLNDHDLVLDTFKDRVEECMTGQNVMNCLNCKYREQVLGFEAEVGLPQESHHHHVEGGDKSEGHSHDHSHDHAPGHAHEHAHGHSHDHSQPHTHHPYPHNDHPMGPWSLPGSRQGDHLVCPCGRWAVTKDDERFGA